MYLYKETIVSLTYFRILVMSVISTFSLAGKKNSDKGKTCKKPF